MNPTNPIVLILTWIALALVPARAADSTTPTTARSSVGTIEGRVFNPATGEYVRYAEIRIQGTSILANTAADGRYRITNVPAGPVTIVVNHSGFQPATASVNVSQGGITTRDFELQTAAAPGEEVIQLGQFKVSGEREGTAKAIMEQRNALTIKNVVASDTFSIMTEGNIGEVLQYLPGIQIRYTDGEPANPMMRGMAAKYGALQIDGVRMTGGGTRASELTSYSASATDTIEYIKTNSADMDADAPAGTINMKSKSAFQRKGRYFGWQAYSIISAADNSLGKSPGPEDREIYKTLPSVMLDFSDVYMDGKLGVVLNLGENNSVHTSGFLNPTYDTTPTAYNPAPIVITQLIFGINPKYVKRRSGGLNLEYNLNPNLTVALRGQIGWEDWRQPQRAVALASTRAAQAPNASVTAMLANPTTNNATRFGIQGSHTNRTRLTYTFAPQVTYEKGPISVDASIAHTYLNSYTRNGRLDGEDDPFFQANYQLFGVGFSAVRESPGSTSFDFQQTSGPDMYILNNWRTTSLTNNLVRVENEPTSKSLIGQINAKYTTDWSLPTYFKVGGKAQAGQFTSVNRNNSWTYVGPENNRLTTNLPVSVAFRGVEPLVSGNIFDRPFQFPDRTALGVLQRTNPEYFVPNPTNATSTTNLFPTRLAREYIDAVYVMANTQIGRLTLQEGIRYEETKTQGKVYERGVPRTRTGAYDNVFLSASGRYRFKEDLMLIAGFSQSIQRASLSSLAAVATINETTMTGTIPNPNLKPERGDNYSIRVEKYFEPAGVFSAGVFMFRMKDYHAQLSAVPAEEIGLGDEYPNYLFTTQDNVDDFDTKGLELEYRQQLTFLPGVFRGLGVFANWTQTQSSDPELDYAAAPKFASGGLSFRWRRLNASVSGTWASAHNQNPTIMRYRERTIISTNWSYQLTARTSFFLTGRNIFNSANYKTLRAFPGVHAQTLIQDAVWSFGFKGNF